MLLMIVFTVLVNVQTANAQEKKEQWPGVTIKVLTENDFVAVKEVIIAPGAVADWHPHPKYTVYAVTDVKMKEEIEGKQPNIIDIKAGQAMFSPAKKHKTTNIGKKPFTVIVTEIK